MAELDKSLLRVTRLNIRLERIISGLVAFIIYFFSVIIALNQVGLLSIIIQWLSYAVVIAILISLTLGLRDIIPNLFAGLSLKRKLKLRVGKKINVGTVKGKISKLNSLYVHVVTKDEEIILVPYSQLMKEKTKIN